VIRGKKLEINILGNRVGRIYLRDKDRLLEKDIKMHLTTQ
jgi:hypothetical protein